jgi:hypothetical protein
MVLAIFAALVAAGDTTGESLLFDGVKAHVIAGEFSVELVSGISEVSGDGLSLIHSKNSMLSVLLVVKG